VFIHYFTTSKQSTAITSDPQLITTIINSIQSLFFTMKPPKQLNSTNHPQTRAYHHHHFNQTCKFRTPHQPKSHHFCHLHPTEQPPARLERRKKSAMKMNQEKE
jgi:hypothetical protein